MILVVRGMRQKGRLFRMLRMVVCRVLEQMRTVLLGYLNARVGDKVLEDVVGVRGKNE